MNIPLQKKNHCEEEMFAKSTIAIFDGSKGREYYSICDTWATGETSVYYDIDFPLNLALKLNRIQCNDESKKFGFIHCGNCQAHGMYRNIAMIPCGNCIKRFPEYSCDCFDGRMSFTEYVDDLHALDIDDMTHWSCGPDCVWFASNAIYGALDTKNVRLSPLHANEVCTQKLAYMTKKFQEEEKKMAAAVAEMEGREEEEEEEEEKEEGEVSDNEVADEETVLENSVNDLSQRSLSPQDQAILDQFSEFCDRIIRGDHF